MNKKTLLIRVSERRINSYNFARSVLAHSEMEKDAKGKTSNEKSRIKKSILNYNDEIISASSTAIAIKKEKLHLPRCVFHPKEKKQIKLIIYMKSINKPE